MRPPLSQNNREACIANSQLTCNHWTSRYRTIP